MSNVITDRIKNIRRTKDPKKVVAKAAELLEEHPEVWTQGAWIVNSAGAHFNEDDYFMGSCDVGGVCKVCLEGALLIYAKDEDTYYSAKKLVSRALRGGIGSTNQLYTFNDASYRTREEVVALLKVAAGK